MWDGICAASKAAVAAAALPASAYKSVGLSSQRGTILMLDENKNNLMPSMVWNDGRALKYQEEFAKEISPEDYQTHTGMQLSPLWSAAKIAWLRDNDRDVFVRTRWFANGQEYFLHRMGAEEWVTDPASLTLNGMMEIAKLDWSDRILALCGIDRDRVPPVGIPSGQAGTLSATAAAETGLPAGIPICRGAGDQQCAAIGAGVVNQGQAEFTVGTAGVMVAHLDSLDRIQGRNLWWGGHAVPGAWDIEGGAFALGASLKWWRDNLGATEQIAADTIGESVYSLMVNKALTAPPGRTGCCSTRSWPARSPRTTTPRPAAAGSGWGCTTTGPTCSERCSRAARTRCGWSSTRSSPTSRAASPTCGSPAAARSPTVSPTS